MKRTFDTERNVEAAAANYEYVQAFREMWEYGFPRCPLTRYTETAFRVADELNKRPA
ncbi:hypothetical protein ACIOJE_07800 [Kitasatospora sp. NPDC087861]|uniref:hypothetical protein n=1 Tax=Kitasatospora sp. NPDC087861 TaxID=3364070 RepID=UPI003807DDC6